MSKEMVAILVPGTFLSVGVEQFKKVEMHFQPGVLVEVEIPKAEFKGYKGTGKNKVPIVTPLGYALIGEALKKAQVKSTM